MDLKKKLRVGVLGATGMVGQQYVHLLDGHPWFEVTYVAASPASAGKRYAEALRSGWHVAGEIPASAAALVVRDVADVERAAAECDLVFSAFEMPDKEAIRKAESEHAAAGLPVFSNASAHRWTDDVPMIVAEINPHHLDIIPAQQKAHGWKKGFLVVKPNCSIQSYLTPLYALLKAGYALDKVFVTTMQATSGAGYPGVASLDMIDNVVPYISGEEEKTEQEPLKILGSVEGSSIVSRSGLSISAQCNRVPVSDGHLAAVSISFAGKKPTMGEVKELWSSFRGEPQELDLPMAPEHPIHIRKEDDRPQPKKDRDVDKAMAVSVGRLRECPVLDYKFVALSHNTVRGAAGGGILNAELAFKRDLYR